jgi:sodium/bile acid cotransporter 7
LIILSFYPLVASTEGQSLWLAFLFLAALPSTVSSSVVMVSMAKGNLPAAIFNASISGLIGIIVTPLWMGLFMEQNVTEFQLGDVYIKLVTEILVPVLLGLFIQRFWGKYALRYASQLSVFDKSIILIIIYKSFAHAFDEGIFESVGLIDLTFISIASLVLFFVVLFITGFLSDWLGFSTEDKITTQFCGTKKSLVHGTVFSKILFPASFPVAMILLPLMIFHALQILIVSIIAAKWAKRQNF